MVHHHILYFIQVAEDLVKSTSILKQTADEAALT